MCGARWGVLRCTCSAGGWGFVEVEVTGDGALVFVSYDVMEHFVDV